MEETNTVLDPQAFLKTISAQDFCISACRTLPISSPWSKMAVSVIASAAPMAA